jgi:hypothetical protein
MLMWNLYAPVLCSFGLWDVVFVGLVLVVSEEDMEDEGGVGGFQRSMARRIN